MARAQEGKKVNFKSGVFNAMRTFRSNSVASLCLGLLSLATSALAENKSFPLGGTNAVLQDASEAGILFTAMRFNRAIDAWNVDVTLTNGSATLLQGPFVLLVDHYAGTTGPIQPDGTDPSNPTNAWYDFTPLAPGSLLATGDRSGDRTLTLGLTNGNPSLNARVFARSKTVAGGLALVRSLNEVGQPLGGVTIRESGPASLRTNTTDSAYGVATLGQGAGDYAWQFSAPGCLSAWLAATLPSNAVTVLSDPLLVRRTTNSLTLTPLDGGALTDNSGSIRISFSPGAFAQTVTGVLTPLTAQTLPARLPLGWSPLQAFALELGSEPASPGTAQLQPWGPVAASEQTVLARWNVNRLEWDALALISSGTNGLAPALGGSGSYALVVPDSGALAPPAAQPGQALQPSTVAPQDFTTIQATGTVTPQSSPASTVAEQVTAQAHVVFTNTTGVSLPSGVALCCQVSEQYQMRDGSSRALPPYERFIVAYQRPGDAFNSTLEATFPMRPILLLGADTLMQATVQVDVYPPSPFSGGLLSAAGGRVSTGALTISAAASDLVSGQLVQLRTLAPTNFSSYVTNGLVIVNAFDLTVAGVVPGRHLALAASGLSTNALFVLASVVCQNGWYGLQPIQRLASDATGALSSLEPSTGSRLPGITGSGQYLLVQVGSPQALISGIARNSAGQPASGLPARIVGQPWLAFSGVDGSFQLLSAVGAATVAITDPVSGNPGQTSVTVTNVLNTYLANVGASTTGPSVTWVTPTNGATAVPLVSSVVVQFAKPLNPATLGTNGIQLLDTNSQPVAANLTLSLSGTTATLLPTSQLAASMLFTIQVSSRITDAAGLPLAGPASFTFTTASSLLNRDPSAQLITFEPTNGSAVVVGTPGLAEPNAAVVILNQTSGRAATVISNPDGSFTNTIAATVDDVLIAVLMNHNGTSNSVTVSQQVFQDGSVGLFNAGGTIQAAGENGPIQLTIEAGSIQGKAKFKIEPVPLAQVQAAMSNTPPEIGKLLGGFKYSRSGDGLAKSPDFSFPIKLSDLGLPQGVSPTNLSFGLAIAQQMEGQSVYVLMDRMHYENGNLVTHSLPFLGLLGPYEDILIIPLLCTVEGTGLTVSGHVYSMAIDSSGAPIKGSQQYLGGALVGIVDNADSSRGRVRAGMVVAITRPNGAFTILVPPYHVNSFPALMARHPYFPDQSPQGQAPGLDAGQRFALADAYDPVDLVFTRAPDQAFPPVITASHAPEYPNTTNTAVVTILATGSQTPPAVTCSVANVVSANSSLPSGSIHVMTTLINTETVGSFGTRLTVGLTCSDPAQVTLAIQAIGDGGLVSATPYSIPFGPPPPSPSNAVAPADTNDLSGPMVVTTSPAPDSTGLSPGMPIDIYFNKPIDRDILNYPAYLTIWPVLPTPTLSLSADQTMLSVVYQGMQPGTNYTLTVGTGIRDLNGNPFSQYRNLNVAGAPYSFSFGVAPARAFTMAAAAPGAGSGAALLGGYAYLLESQGFSQASLGIYSLDNLPSPTKINEIVLPTMPRDMVLIPGYSFWTTNGGGAITVDGFTNIVKRDLAVIIGGGVGPDQFEWIRIWDISDPLRPQRVLGAIIDGTGQYAATRLRWSAPSLAVLETGPVDHIQMINLQEFIIGQLLSLNQDEYMKLPRNGTLGVDLNGDGEYTDSGESPPMPARHPLEFAGETFVWALPDTDQTIIDVDIGAGGNYVGVLADKGHLNTTNGLPGTVPVKWAYRTLASGGLNLDRTLASYDFSDAYYPRRLTTLLKQPVVITNELLSMDLALVSLRVDSAASNCLDVIDITDPLKPSLLVEIPLSKDGGNTGVYTTERRPDGMLLLAGTSQSFLLDPTQFGQPTGPSGWPPALVAVLPGMGGLPKTFASSPEGLQFSAQVGAMPVLFQTAPQIQYVSFPGSNAISSASLAGASDDTLNRMLKDASYPDFLLPMTFRATGGACASITNLSTPHYYVLLYAPGGAGPRIELALQGLNSSGLPLHKHGFLFPPVYAFHTNTLTALGDLPGTNDAPVRSSTAYRLSNNQASPYYNIYLSRPFALLAEELSTNDLATITAQLDRDVLWSPAYLRASIDPVMSNNAAIGPYAGTIVPWTLALRPGVSTIARAFAADYQQSPNPAPLTSESMAPLALNCISPHNGELVVNASDITLPGRRIVLEFRRTFAAQGLYDGPFGRGWDFNFNQRVVEVPSTLPCAIHKVDHADPNSDEVGAPGNLLFYNGAGRIVVYQLTNAVAPEIAHDPLVQNLAWLPKTTACYLPPKGLFSPMFKFTDGTYARLEPDGRQYWFDYLGRLKSVYDRYTTNSLQMVYNNRGELAQILDESQRALDIGYWRLSSDPTIRPGIDDTTTDHGSLGRICRLMDYCGRDLRFYYSSDGLLLRREGPEVQTAKLSGFLGRQVTTYGYSDCSQPTRTACSLVAVTGQEPGALPMVSVSDFSPQGRDNVRSYRVGSIAYNINQNFANTARSLAAGGGISSFSDSTGFKADYQFDKLGHLTNSVVQGTNMMTITNSTEYWSDGSVKRTIFPEGNSIEYYYDTNNPSLRSRGNCLATVRNPGPRGGPVLTSTVNYDPWYNLEAGDLVDFNGNITHIDLDGDHLDAQVITKAGERETIYHNDCGQISIHTSIDGIESAFAYTSDGFVWTESLGAHQETSNYTSAGGGANAHLRGLPSSIIDPQGIETDFEYDELGRFVRVTHAGTETVYGYDQYGNLAAKQERVETNRVVLTTYAYSDFGFLKEKRIHDLEVMGTNADLVVTYEPDDQNRIKTATLPSGEKHLFQYDDLGCVTSFESVGSFRQTFDYDRNGNMVAIHMGAATESYVYDGHDRMIEEVLGNGTQRIVVFDNNDNQTTNMLVDAKGKLLAESTVMFDALDRITNAAVRRNSGWMISTTAFNSKQRTQTLTSPGGGVVVSHMDANGHPYWQEHPNYNLRQNFDGNDRLTDQTVDETDLSVTDQYGYNDRNQLIAETNSVGQARQMSVEIDGRVVESVDRVGRHTQFRFSRLGELLSKTNLDGVTEFKSYDLGRHLATIADVAHDTTTNHYDPQGRLTEVDLPNGARTLDNDFDNYLQPRSNALPRDIVVHNYYDVDGYVTNRIVHSPRGDRQELYTYDGMRRIQSLTDPSGSVSFQYDLAGFVRETDHQYQFSSNPVQPAGFGFALKQEADDDGTRSQFWYPDNAVVLDYRRDATGQLTGLSPEAGEVIFTNAVWVGDARLGSYSLGADRIHVQLTYDPLRRVTSRQCVAKSTGRVLLDLRYAFDQEGAIVARQDLHRGGRTDFYQYDDSCRLVRADRDARPTLSAGEPVRAFSGFTLPVGFTAGSWAPGAWARHYDYTPTDLLTGINLINPNALATPVQGSSFSGVDSLLFAGTVDGFVRSRDDAGNITRTMLAVRIPGSASPALVPATLTFNDLGQLTLIERQDGVRVYCEYDPKGYRIRRAVTGPANLCEPSDLAFIYDDSRLIEERDLAAGGQVVRRYFYGDNADELFAADLIDHGTANRVYYLTDTLRSVRVLTDAQANAIERVNYEAWGQPQIELADTVAPAVSSIVWEGSSLLVVFTEPVAPAGFAAPAKGAFLGSWGTLASAFQVRVGGSPVGGQVFAADDAALPQFGAALRFVPSASLSGSVSVSTVAGAVRDEWGNTNAAEAFTFSLPQTAGTVVASGKPAGSTASPLAGRSSAGSPILFHGQYFDYETGLVYCRGRYFDPLTASFLSRDPHPYSDSVNQYAAFANNPVNYRDPSGQWVEKVLAWCDHAGKELSDAGAQADYNKDGVVGLVLGHVFKRVGGLLQTREIISKGAELANSGRQGRAGMLDALMGADMMAGGVHNLIHATQKTFKFTRSAFRTATRMRGMLGRSRPRMEMPESPEEQALLNQLHGQGLTTPEALGTIQGLREWRKFRGHINVELGIREIAPEKRAGRQRILAEYGADVAQKSVASKAKVPSAGWTEKWQTVRNAMGRLVGARKQKVVSDIDLFMVKADGRRLGENEVLELAGFLNRGVREQWKKQGLRGVPSAPYKHGAVVNFPSFFGLDIAAETGEAGQHVFHPLNHEILNKVPPGRVFTISVGHAGHVTYERMHPQFIRREVQETFDRYPDVFNSRAAGRVLRRTWMDSCGDPNE